MFVFRYVSGDIVLFTAVCLYFRYVRGDIVMFTAVKMMKSKSTLAALLHLQQNKPFILLDNTVYVNFNIRPGKVYATCIVGVS